MSEEIPRLRGMKLSGRAARRPSVIEGRRVCQESSCKTVLSRYNTSDACQLHRPARFPRVRGVMEPATPPGM